ncbi:MAG TPA: hypothetical protein DEB16_00320, partial [Ruminococcaceae bacterium]|nr:hypothetical protein [Oscillospiraceae bacterium]
NRKFRRTELPCDTVITAVGYRPENSLFRRLNGKIAELYLVGDAFSAQNIETAIWTANEVALHI